MSFESKMSSEEVSKFKDDFRRTKQREGLKSLKKKKKVLISKIEVLPVE